MDFTEGPNSTHCQCSGRGSRHCHSCQHVPLLPCAVTGAKWQHSATPVVSIRRDKWNCLDFWTLEWLNTSPLRTCVDVFLCCNTRPLWDSSVLTRICFLSELQSSVTGKWRRLVELHFGFKSFVLSQLRTGPRPSQLIIPKEMALIRQLAESLLAGCW